MERKLSAGKTRWAQPVTVGIQCQPPFNECFQGFNVSVSNIGLIWYEPKFEHIQVICIFISKQFY